MARENIERTHLTRNQKRRGDKKETENEIEKERKNE